jgi:hypothetical protein
MVGKERDESWEDLLVSGNAVGVIGAHRARAVDIQAVRANGGRKQCRVAYKAKGEKR